MTSLPLVIVNPTSAGGSTGASWPRTASDLRTHFGPFTCAFTERPGDGKTLALHAANEGRKFVIACGGDGTISDVANGILESGKNAEMGILPSGTGGDFRRSLLIPNRTTAAARILRNGRTRRIDVGRASYLNHSGILEVKYFVGVGSFGMSSEVIRRVKNKNLKQLSTTVGPRWLGGRIAFAVAALATTLSAEKTEVFIKADEKAEKRLRIVNFCIANARYFGGGMKIAPRASLSDGEFDVVSIGDLGRFDILLNSPQLYLGTHLGMSQVHHFHAKTLTARSTLETVEVDLELDGELAGRLPAVFEMLPAALEVRCPK